MLPVGGWDAGPKACAAGDILQGCLGLRPAAVFVGGHWVSSGEASDQHLPLGLCGELQTRAMPGMMQGGAVHPVLEAQSTRGLARQARGAQCPESMQMGDSPG